MQLGYKNIINILNFKNYNIGKNLTKILGYKNYGIIGNNVITLEICEEILRHQRRCIK